MPGEGFEDLAPDLDVILVDGEDLLGVLEELEAFEVFAKHFDDIQVESAVDTDTTEGPGLLDRLTSWFD